MTTLALKIDNKNILIKTPCLFRATCYEHLASTVLQQLFHSFHKNPFLSPAVLEPGLIEGLVKILDREVCRYVDRDLQNYRREAGKTLKDLDSKQALIKYYHDRSYGYESYGAYLNKNFLALENLLERVSGQFQDAMTKALTRIDADQNQLVKLFLSPESDQPVHLIRIIPTFSDLHKGGQQVLVLEFAIKNQATAPEQCIRLIYKPSSVLVDMMFLGNTGKIKACGIQDMPGLDSAQSITEIVNDAIINAFTPLPSYLIYPREHANVIDSYGYIEYLPHQPWPENLEEKIFKAIANEENNAKAQNRRPKYNSSVAEAVIKDQFNMVLIEAQRKMTEENLPCDYIAKNEAEHQRYSYQCGMLAAVATAFGITDMHIQNLVISQVQPYLIDLEISFNQVEANINETGFIDDETGSMIKTATESTSLHFLNSIEGLDSVGISLPQKNRFYRLDPDRNKPLLVNPLTAFFQQGFTAFMDLLAGKKNLFAPWLAHPLVQTMSVRILPYATNNFIQWLSEYQSECTHFYPNEDQSIRKAFLNNIEEEEIKDFILKRKTELSFTIFASNNVQDNFDSLNIPVFYMKVSENRLIDSAGNTVVINYNKIVQICGLNEEEIKILLQSARENYFVKTPLQFITEQIEKIRQDGEYRQQLITTSIQQSQEAFKELQSENISLPNSAATVIESNSDERSSLLWHQSGQSNSSRERSCTSSCNIL